MKMNLGRFGIPPIKVSISLSTETYYTTYDIPSRDTIGAQAQ